jgi:hypothetical protein
VPSIALRPLARICARALVAVCLAATCLVWGGAASYAAVDCVATPLDPACVTTSASPSPAPTVTVTVTPAPTGPLDPAPTAVVSLDPGQFTTLTLFAGVVVFVLVVRFLYQFGSRSPVRTKGGV